MGKSKTNKFKRPHFSVGLPVNAVKEVDVEEYDSDGPAAELLEKVREQPIVLLNKRLCCSLSFYNMRENEASAFDFGKVTPNYVDYLTNEH